MKILFLDIDGVLNYMGCKERYAGLGAYDRGFWGIQPEKVQLLNEVLKRTGAKVVLSSTWRTMQPLEDTIAYLKRQGFEGELIDKTPIHSDGFRGFEVNAWLAGHPEVACHAIVDDDSDFLPSQPLVRTNINYGLTPENVEELVKKLGSTDGV